MTFGTARTKKNSGILIPIMVGITLVGSAIALASADGYAESTVAATPHVTQSTEAEYLKSIGIVASAIAGPGFAVWYAYHMTTKRIPDVEHSHQQMIEKMQADHKCEVKELIDNFRADIKGFWETKRQDDNLLRDVMKSIVSK